MKEKRKVSYIMDHKSKATPFIRLTGKWLSDLGFKVGNQFHITVESNQIILQPMNKEQLCKQTQSML